MFCGALIMFLRYVLLLFNYIYTTKYNYIKLMLIKLEGWYKVIEQCNELKICTQQ